MITMLKNWKGAVTINGVDYESIDVAMKQFTGADGEIHITLHKEAVVPTKQRENTVVEPVKDADEVTITVKPYMTKQATPEFDFMSKWNNNRPMPCRVMAGTKVKETRGMVYMKLHALTKPTITCYCCGKELTNPVSRLYGIGPVCLSKIGIVRDIEDVEGIKEELVKIEWEGWVIKSAILSET